jgi:hypothetical protein
MPTKSPELTSDFKADALVGACDQRNLSIGGLAHKIAIIVLAGC